MLSIDYLIFIAFLMSFSCSSKDDSEITGGKPVPEPTFETDILIEGLKDSVEVESSLVFTLQIKREGCNDNFELTVDTVIPVYTFHDWIDWEKVPENSDVIPPEAIRNIIRKGVQMNLNGNPIEKNMPIQANRKYDFTFSKPQVVGNYEIKLKVKDQKGNEYHKDVSIKVYSPEILIKVYNVDPWLDLKIFDKNFYEELNRDYTYNPLSDVFQGKEIDTVITYETPKPGYPGEFTYPGIGLTLYFQQEGAKEFVYKLTQPQGSQNAFLPRWDNDAERGADTYPQYQGFHCFELLTWSKDISGGTYQYQICLTDYWGKTQTKIITLLAISNREN